MWAAAAILAILAGCASRTAVPADAASWFRHAESLRQQSRLREAVAAYTAAIELDRGFVEAYHNRAGVRAIRGDLSGAVCDYTEVLRLAPRDAATHFNRGNARACMHYFESALEDLSRAIDIDPGLAAAYESRAAALGALGRHAEAEADLRMHKQLATQQGRPR